MANRRPVSKSSAHKPDEQPLPSWARVALALTLVPLVGGLLLMAAWALDIQLTRDLESQAWVGLLFMLLSFVLSNLIQRRWRLFLGWLLLSLADLILLVWVSLYAQGMAGIIGVAGILILGIEFYGRIAENNQANR